MKVMLDVQFTKELENNDVLVYQKGVWTNISSKEYFKLCHKKIDDLKHDCDLVNKQQETLNEMFLANGHKLMKDDLLIAKNIYDNFVDKGLIEDDEEFEKMWFDFYFNDSEQLNLENAPQEYNKILNKVGNL